MKRIIKRTIKLYKPRGRTSFPYKIVEDETPGKVLVFRNNREREIYRKEEKKKEWERWKKWEEKMNKKCYQRFLKEFKITHSQLEKLNIENFDVLLGLNNFFLDLYYPALTEKEDGNVEVGGKGKTSEEKENLMAIFFNKIIEIEAKKYANFYRLDWEDLIQEFEIELIKKRGTYNLKKGANLLTYYKLLIRHRAIDLARNSSRSKTTSLEEIEKEIISPSQLENIDLNNALEKLTPKQEEAIRLVYFDDFTQEQAATKLNITQQTLNDRLQGASKKMKKYL